MLYISLGIKYPYIPLIFVLHKQKLGRQKISIKPIYANRKLKILLKDFFDINKLCDFQVTDAYNVCSSVYGNVILG